MSKLPKGWVTALLTDIAQPEKFSIVDGPFGSDLKLTDYTADGIVPVLTTKNLNGTYDPTAVRFISAEKFEHLKRSKVEGGDVLIAKIGSIGKCSIYPIGAPTAIIPANLCKITSNDRVIDRRFLLWYIRSYEFQSKLQEITSATAQPAFSVKRLKTLKVKLPPINEQRRIVAGLEKLLSRVNAAQERLATIPRILKHFRESVLAAACSGRLTDDWREQNQLTFDGLRRKSQQKYEPAESRRPEIPSVWNWLLISDVAAVIDPQPSHRTPPEFAGGIPYVGMGDITKTGEIDFDNARLVSSDVFREHQERYRLSMGDFIFGKIGTLGKPAKLPAPFNYTLSANLVLVQPFPKIANPGFLFLYMQSPEMNWMLMSENRATSQPAFGIKRIRRLPIPLPPGEEQQEIVRRVGDLFKTADALEARYHKARMYIDKLTQSILAKAFRGELVHQDSSDESAAELLARIKNSSHR